DSRRRERLDGAAARVDDPDQLRAPPEILVAFALHLGWGVALAEDFDREIGAEVRDRLVELDLTVRETVPGNEGDVGYPDHARSQTHDPARTGHRAKVARVSPV